MKCCWLLFVLALISGYVVAQNYSAKEIVKLADDKNRGLSSKGEMTMTIVRPDWSRSVTMKSWSKENDFAMVLITSPAKEKGQVFLKRRNEMWNWVPSIDKMVKMPPSMMSQSWMGSDFTNDDLVRGSSSTDDFTHRLLRTEKMEGTDCYVIELIPKPESSVVYSKVLMWVSKDSYLQLRTENYDEEMNLASTIIQRKIIRLGGRELPSEMEMIPADKKGNKTIITITKIEFNPPLSDEFFSVQHLKSIK